ncbi:MAG: hypothetical protein ABIP03_03080 [Aquihabitans sp.]
MHHHRQGIVNQQGEDGASLVEYALLLALIAAVCLGAVTFFGQAAKGQVDNNSNCIGTAFGGTPSGVCTTP